MNKRQWSAVSGIAVGALVATSLAAPMSAQAAPASKASVVNEDPAATQSSRPDNLPHPLAEAQAKLREEAVTKLVKGEAKTKTINGNRVIEVKAAKKGKKGKYVNYPVNREEDIFTILVEFGDQIHPATQGTPGPLHNEIPEPDRNWDGNSTDDNTTYWVEDFNRAHFLDLMFGQGDSLRDFYQKQSNGRFLAKGDVSDWVKVPYNEARYGSNNFAQTSTYWPFVRDTAQAWYDDQIAAGKTQAEITDYLKQFDIVDRYDYDGDGDFNEPDGYIDHFQAIHAGEGEEAGGGAQGADAIWSHRWYAYSTSAGTAGPDFNKLGGVPLGDSGIWIGDYTTEPENGGLGVFAHEFGHDLGLPDLYDTQGGDNGTGFWTLMSSGSWLNRGGNAIGTTPGYMGPWEKLQLGWLDYQVVPYGENTNVRLNQADLVTKNSSVQAVAVTLPDKTVVTEYNTPYAGDWEWWSGDAHSTTTTLTRTVDLTGKTSASLSAQLQTSIEAGYDYLYVQASTNGGTSWTNLDSITGPSETELSAWGPKTWDLSAYAGAPVTVRFAYVTDPAVGGKGAFLDDITLTVDGQVVDTDGAESETSPWTADGFTRINGTSSEQVSHFYLAENRVYSGYDRTLKLGPYNFGWANTKPNWVERFPYHKGMLVWYIDNEYEDNNTSQHPGHGQVLPVDARPTPTVFPDGTLLGNRRQVWDATFGIPQTEGIWFHRNGEKVYVRASEGIPTFDDSDPDRYWSAANPQSSTKVAGTGTTITVQRTLDGGNELRVRVAFK